MLNRIVIMVDSLVIPSCAVRRRTAVTSFSVAVDRDFRAARAARRPPISST